MNYAGAIAGTSAVFLLLAIAALIIGYEVYHSSSLSRIERRGRRIQIWGGSFFGGSAVIGFLVSIWLAFAQAAAGV